LERAPALLVVLQHIMDSDIKMTSIGQYKSNMYIDTQPSVYKDIIIVVNKVKKNLAGAEYTNPRMTE